MRIRTQQEMKAADKEMFFYQHSFGSIKCAMKSITHFAQVESIESNDGGCTGNWVHTTSAGACGETTGAARKLLLE